MRSRLPALVAVAVLVALSLPAIAGARSAPSAAEAARAEHDRIVAYWTPERIAAARPRDIVRTVVGFTVAPKPIAKPGRGGGGGGNVTGASWGGASQDVIRSQSGRILFTMSGGQWICSGSVISTASNTQSVILTAGHCVTDGPTTWASNFMFIPDFDEGPNYTCNSSGQVFGCWTATRLAANTAFVSGGGFGNDTLDVDYGFALVGLGGKASADLETTVGGGYTLNTTLEALNVQQWAFGYPAEGRYKGKDLIYCTNATTSLINDPYGADTWGMACNMNGGSSGGPWNTGTTDPGTIAGSVSSLNSYGYSNLRGYMFGPKFDGDTITVLNAVISGNGGGVAVVH
jgi:V8-like Glu-specific endopeptidase